MPSFFSFCKRCSGTREKQTNITHDVDLFYNPITSFKNIPDIKITQKTKCYCCKTKIEKKEYISICNHTVFFFCKEECYLKWLKKTPTYEINTTDEIEL